MFNKQTVVEKSAVIQLAQILLQRQGGVLTDQEVLLAPEAWETWAPDRPYGAGQVISHNEQLYRVVSDIAKSQKHQPPDGAGLLAVYRPIGSVDPEAGTAANPIPYVYGMDCLSGKYYSYNGKKYLCNADMIPCVWAPGTAGLWQWTEQK